MARWTHLFPSRTQKLSTVVAKVSGFPGRIASRRAFSFLVIFYCYNMVMEKYHLVNLRSAIGQNDAVLDSEKKQFIETLSQRFNIIFSSNKTDTKITLFLIETGGTEEAFLNIYQSFSPPYYLLTTKTRNSLPAALEIGAFLSQQNLPYIILHGDFNLLGQQLQEITFKPQSKIKQFRLGVIGQPSDWLIASKIDRDVAREKYGISFIDISFEELAREIDVKNFEMSEKVRKIAQINANNPYLEGALSIYGALKRLINKHDLAGFSIRCFDLLKPYKNTSCLALALLNDEGYLGGCEGDLPILVSMEMVYQALDLQAFQANPSSVDLAKKEVIFAHCTVPFAMCSRVSYFSHFESDLGIGIRGELKLGPCTIFRLSSDLRKALILEGEIIANTKRDDLCRTQIIVSVKEGINKLLDQPLGNHQLIIYGHHQNELVNYLKILYPALQLV